MVPLLVYVAHVSQWPIPHRFGEGSADQLPVQSLRPFEFLSRLEPIYFMLACWITAVYFPLMRCADLERQEGVCTALHGASLLFVASLADQSVSPTAPALGQTVCIRSDVSTVSPPARPPTHAAFHRRAASQHRKLSHT